MKRESCRCRPMACVTFALICIAVWSAGSPASGESTRLEIPAWSFDRGNGRVVENPDTYADYRDRHPNLIVTGGDKSPWEVEYDIELPVDATYTLSICYASAESRPVELWLDNRMVATCCRSATGYPAPYPDRFSNNEQPRLAENFHGLQWEEACKLPIPQGKHTLKLTCAGPPPHVAALRLDSSVSFPGDWKPVGPALIADVRGIPRYRGRNRYNMAFAQPNPKMKLDRIPPVYRSFFLPPGSVNVATLGLAIEDVIAEFGPEYPEGPRYLKRLAELENRRRATENGSPEQIQKAEDHALGAGRCKHDLAVGQIARVDVVITAGEASALVALGHFRLFGGGEGELPQTFAAVALEINADFVDAVVGLKISLVCKDDSPGVERKIEPAKHSAGKLRGDFGHLPAGRHRREDAQVAAHSASGIVVLVDVPGRVGHPLDEQQLVEFQQRMGQHGLAPQRR